MTEIKSFENLQVVRSGMRNAAMRVVDYSQVQINPEAVQNVNEIFRELAITFPAWRTAYPDTQSLNSAKQVWAKGLIENGITDMALIRVGLRVARSQPMPFIPSVGQFVAWCRSGESNAAGLPDADELYRMLMKYCAERSLYNSPEEYPWPSNAAYWMVTRLYDAMRSQGLTESETRKRCVTELNDMASRIQAGEEIPKPVKQIPKLYIPVPKEVGIARIAEIKRKYFRGRI